MKRILLALLCLALGSCMQAEAARIRSTTKTCPGGVTVRSNQRCPTAAPQFSVADASVNEGSGTVTIHITKAGGNGSSSALTYATANGTATAGSDYTAASGTITFLAGETDKTVTVAITADASAESTETFTLTIAASSNATLARATGTVSITDSSSASAVSGIADNFTTASGLQASPGYTAPPSGEEVGAFRIVCASGQILRDDPIKYFGQPGVSHLHQYWGNNGANANSTYTSLRTTGSSSCEPTDLTHPINRTAYWMPAMLDGAGYVVKPDFINTYYKQVPASSSECHTRAASGCVGLPAAIEAIFGYNMATGQNGPMDSNSADYYAFKFECWTTPTSGIAAVSPPAGTHFTNIADVVTAGCPAGAGLIIYFSVPGCWDGIHLDSADHRSHLSYGTPETGLQVCPADHPYLITPWQGHVHYTTDANFVAGNWHLSSDEMLPGFVVGPGSPVKAGKSLHFDYFEAWSPAVKTIWQTNCIDGHLNCSGGDIGNGQQIKGADGASLPAPHTLVPVP